jgi:AcrR family transcriptional regulator
MATAASPAIRADAARNRARILDSARGMLAEGDLAPSMNELAERAGVGVGTVYRHFPDHQVLLEGLAEDAFSRLVDDARAAAREEDPVVGFSKLMHAALRLLLKDEGLATVLRRAERPACAQTVDLGAELKRAMNDLLPRARAAGAIGEDVGPEDLRRLLIGVHAAAAAGDKPKAAAARYLDLILAGLRA